MQNFALYFVHNIIILLYEYFIYMTIWQCDASYNNYWVIVAGINYFISHMYVVYNITTRRHYIHNVPATGNVHAQQRCKIELP